MLEGFRGCKFRMHKPVVCHGGTGSIMSPIRKKESCYDFHQKSKCAIRLLLKMYLKYFANYASTSIVRNTVNKCEGDLFNYSFYHQVDKTTSAECIDVFL